MECSLWSFLLFCIFVLSTVNVDCQEPAAPYITFKGNLLQNHSYVDFFEIGRSSINGVQCHTDLTTCCNSRDGSGDGGRGQWYTPGGRKLWNYSRPLYQEVIHQGLAIASTQRTNRRLNGIYRCDIDTNGTAHGSRASVYVGIYSTSGGGEGTLVFCTIVLHMHSFT